MVCSGVRTRATIRRKRRKVRWWYMRDISDSNNVAWSSETYSKAFIAIGHDEMARRWTGYYLTQWRMRPRDSMVVFNSGFNSVVFHPASPLTHRHLETYGCKPNAMITDVPVSKQQAISIQQCWLKIHFTGLISHIIIGIMNNITKWNHMWKNIQLYTG